MRPALPMVFLVACGGAPRDANYHEHVAPLIDEHCIRCHQPGGLGPGDFTDQDQVLAFAERIDARVQAGTMPPAVADPECRDYVGSGPMSLDDVERETFSRWLERGTPSGDPSAAPSPAVPVLTQLADADLDLRIEGYAPTFSDSRNPGNEYRCFALDPGRDEDFFVTGLDAIIDQEALVHHIVVGVVPRAGVDPDAFTAAGVDCIDDDMGAVENMMAAWAPGSLPQVFEEGAGIRVGTDEVVMLQMHYFDSDPTSASPVDRSGYALRTAPSVQTELEVLTLGSISFRIPAGNEAYTFEDKFRADRDLRVHAVFPHMHQLGAAYSMRIDDRKDGCLVASDVYDFDNQLTYAFTEPVDVKQGETLTWTCTWNNSRSNPDRPFDEPQDTFYGERTDEEMCFFFTLVEKA